jgi:hypothetical protein
MTATRQYAMLHQELQEKYGILFCRLEMSLAGKAIGA